MPIRLHPLPIFLFLVFSAGKSYSQDGGTHFQSYGFGTNFQFQLSSPKIIQINSANGANLNGTYTAKRALAASGLYVKKLNEGYYFFHDLNLSLGDIKLHLPDVEGDYNFKNLQANFLMGKNIWKETFSIQAGIGLGYNLKDNDVIFYRYTATDKPSKFTLGAIGGIQLSLGKLVILGRIQNDFTSNKSKHVSILDPNKSIELNIPRRFYTLGIGVFFN